MSASYWVTLGSASWYVDPADQLTLKSAYDANADGVSDVPIEANTAADAIKEAVQGEYTTAWGYCAPGGPTEHTYTFPGDAGIADTSTDPITDGGEAYNIVMTEDSYSGIWNGSIGLRAQWVDPELVYPEDKYYVGISWGVTADPRPHVWVGATDDDASEDDRDPATFTVSREGGSQGSVDVYFTLGGAATASENPTSHYGDGIADDGTDYTVEGAVPDSENPGYWVVSVPENGAEVTVRPLWDNTETEGEDVHLAILAARPYGDAPAYTLAVERNPELVAVAVADFSTLAVGLEHANDILTLNIKKAELNTQIAKLNNVNTTPEGKADAAHEIMTILDNYPATEDHVQTKIDGDTLTPETDTKLADLIIQANAFTQVSVGTGQMSVTLRPGLSNPNVPRYRVSVTSIKPLMNADQRLAVELEGVGDQILDLPVGVTTIPSIRLTPKQAGPAGVRVQLFPLKQNAQGQWEIDQAQDVIVDDIFLMIEKQEIAHA